MSKESVNKSIQKRNILIVDIIYFILTLGAMSDVFRIPETSLTYFRMCIPISILIIFIYPIWSKRFLLGSAFFVLLNFSLNLIFYRIYETSVTFSISRFIKYSILYLSIYIVFILVCIVKEMSGNRFETDFLRWICIIGGILLSILMLNNINPEFFGNLSIDNPNNYGAYIAAVFPFYLVFAQNSKRYKRYLYIGGCSICIIVLYVNDSKISLLGVLMQIVLLICIMSARNVRTFFMMRFFLPVGATILAIVLVVFLNPTINGYPLVETLLEPITRILEGDPYPTYTASVSFRTNTTIFALKSLWELKGIGLGAGNMGILLKSEFPNLNPEYIGALSADSLSLHNAWLEFMNDFGIVAILLLICPLCYALKIYISKANLCFLEKIVMLFIISFPVWAIGPSGMYTQYYLFTIISFLIICKKDYTIPTCSLE